ncbi:hypothetical protein ZIOFF_032725 [Zingiber officinale]|uniref:RING-type domain-containing protein n=1 Tax=Zingiber officinale TaxID=94328 RepID=A0A8J5L5W0_ZINOF|nr:hypothetical protein ZIOFF_032725 [Zingiber officinale]
MEVEEAAGESSIARNIDLGEDEPLLHDSGVEDRVARQEVDSRAFSEVTEDARERMHDGEREVISLGESDGEDDADGQSGREEPAEEEGAEEGNERGGAEGESLGKTETVELDASSSPNCPVCFEPWKGEGLHRVCCVPCGHVYGRSCLERWLKQCGKNVGKCPQCSKKFRRKEIVNLYAPVIAVPNADLEKEVQCLKKENMSLKIEKRAKDMECFLINVHDWMFRCLLAGGKERCPSIVGVEDRFGFANVRDIRFDESWVEFTTWLMSSAGVWDRPTIVGEGAPLELEMEVQVEMSKRILPKDSKKEKKIKGKGELKVVERRGDTGRRKKEKGRRGEEIEHKESEKGREGEECIRVVRAGRTGSNEIGKEEEERKNTRRKREGNICFFWYKTDARGRNDGEKMACVEHTLSGSRGQFEFFDKARTSASQSFYGKSFVSQFDNVLPRCCFTLQNELELHEARVMGIDGSSHIVIVSGKSPGIEREHVLNKISLLSQHASKIELPPNTSAIKDLRILPNGLALLASLGKKLLLYSMASNNLALKYDLPVIL